MGAFYWQERFWKSFPVLKWIRQNKMVRLNGINTIKSLDKSHLFSELVRQFLVLFPSPWFSPSLQVSMGYRAWFSPERISQQGYRPGEPFVNTPAAGANTPLEEPKLKAHLWNPARAPLRLPVATLLIYRHLQVKLMTYLPANSLPAFQIQSKGSSISSELSI